MINTNFEKKVFAFFISVFFLTACHGPQDVYFSTYDEAIKNGAIENGNIPDAMPRSAHEIYQKSGSGAGGMWLRFKFGMNDIYGFVSQAEEVKPVDFNSIKIPSPRVKWWDRDLKKDISKEGLTLKVYRYKREIRYDINNSKIVSAYFVIDWDSHIVYYWHEL
ncbi:MAG: hypothetical protein OEV28_14185 [Nitrospirota bacterium]|nr:hypothetical protein [Nitrospirota bacterium]